MQFPTPAAPVQPYLLKLETLFSWKVKLTEDVESVSERAFFENELKVEWCQVTNFIASWLALNPTVWSSDILNCLSSGVPHPKDTVTAESSRTFRNWSNSAICNDGYNLIQSLRVQRMVGEP